MNISEEDKENLSILNEIKISSRLKFQKYPTNKNELAYLNRSYNEENYKSYVELKDIFNVDFQFYKYKRYSDLSVYEGYFIFNKNFAEPYSVLNKTTNNPIPKNCLILTICIKGAWVNDEIYKEFKEEIKTYGPIEYDDTNRKYIFSADNSKNIFENYNNILAKYSNKWLQQEGSKEILDDVYSCKLFYKTYWWNYVGVFRPY